MLLRRLQADDRLGHRRIVRPNDAADGPWASFDPVSEPPSG